MSTAWIGAISALIGVFIGASVSIVQLILNHKREAEKHDDNLLVTALTFLTGDENQRSCGISIIEGKYIKNNKYKNMLVPALTSQAVFILLHTQSVESRTEFYNWLRIMELLESFFEKNNDVGEYYNEIGNAFLIKADPDYKDGIEMNNSTLIIWANKYGMNLENEI